VNIAIESLAKNLARALRARRRKVGLSQAKVAILAGKTQSQIARLENGLGDPRFSSVVEVSRALGTEVVLVPIRLLAAVNHLLDQHDPNPTGLSRRKLVGNDPEDAEDGDEYDE
jgi:transcriptional regulator with XRE-family HTH domain